MVEESIDVFLQIYKFTGLHYFRGVTPNSIVVCFLFLCVFVVVFFCMILLLGCGSSTSFQFLDHALDSFQPLRLGMRTHVGFITACRRISVRVVADVQVLACACGRVQNNWELVDTCLLLVVLVARWRAEVFWLGWALHPCRKRWFSLRRNNRSTLGHGTVKCGRFSRRCW